MHDATEADGTTTFTDQLVELLQRAQEHDPAEFRTLAAYASAMADETIDGEEVAAAIEGLGRTEAFGTVERMLEDAGAYAAWDDLVALAEAS